MSSLFDRMFGKPAKGSGSTAKDRLQVVLIHDRFNLPPEKLREMKEEILAVISKYVAVDRESVDIALEQRDRMNSKIRAEIPFSPSRATVDPDENVPDHVKATNLPEFLASVTLPTAPTTPDEPDSDSSDSKTDNPIK